MRYRYLLVICVLMLSQTSFAQSSHYDLPALLEHKGLEVQGREVTALPAEKAIRFSAAEGDGVAWLKGVEFSNGIIELDIRGKDVLQQSFVGIAFHGFSKDSMESVYWRPFNFRAEDAVRSLHMVQYVSLPSFDWERLRTERNGVFEKAIASPPLPTEWFHVKVVVQYPQVTVFVNHETTPSLSIMELSKRTGGKIGLWVGNNSDGDFKNLSIVKK